MSPEPIKSIVIVGGGTAGWMSAAALSKYARDMGVSITLIESPVIETVGVGEATIPQIAKFNAMLGIDEDTFVKETQATFKLGIEFRNWGRIGERYFHPFGTYGVDLEGVSFHHFWAHQFAKGASQTLDDYSLNARAAYSGRFLRPKPEHGFFLNRLAYAFHFDATLYAQFLRRYAEARGVVRIEATVESVVQAPETGFISSLKLSDGQSVGGDLFLDCTGFRGVLIEQALSAGYDDWTDYLPVDRAVAMPTRREGAATPYTKATAHDAGWQWTIPLQHRMGNGYVYCSKFQSQEAAEQLLVSSVDGEPLKAPKHLRFVTGRRHKFWDRNCIAVGLSAGFLEPLESTSIHLIQSSISKLIALFPHKDMSHTLSDEFNRLMGDDYLSVRDFLILHYKQTSRDDSPFWNHVRTMEIPETLNLKMELLRSGGRFFKYDAELFDATSWLAVALGQGLEMTSYNPIAAGLSDSNIEQSLGNIRNSIAKTVEAMPAHDAFIDRYCRAPDIEMQGGLNSA